MEDLSKKTTSLLEARIKNPDLHSPEIIQEYVEELSKRGRVFSEDELKQAVPKPTAPQDNIFKGEPVIHSGWKWRRYGLSVVNDPEAPEFYSQRAISTFSILFGVVFGGAMLAVNMGKAGHPNVRKWMVIFGVLFTVVQIIILNLIGASSSAGFIGSAIGALFLDFFWHRFIGYNTLYRAKPIWIPLIIALAIYIPIMFAIIYEL